jgi:tetratricopeptide (TPR) repeat protein
VGLLLRAVDVEDRYRWRWLLQDEASGVPLADHAVALDPASAEMDAFEDLHRYLRWQADPGRRVETETALVERVGAWIGQRVLGEAVGRQIVAAAPTSVRVSVPQAVEFLLFRPLELAHVDGMPLAGRGDVGFVFDVGAAGRDKQPVARRLRMLAVFSLPTDSTALALRRERFELTRLVRRLAARDRRAVDLEVLQYGVTRQTLKERMTASGGPDVLHISAHGGAGVVVLERRDGSTDAVPTAELLTLLSPGRSRVKLVVVSACQSAAATRAETLGWLRLDEASAQAQAEADAEAGLGTALGPAGSAGPDDAGVMAPAPRVLAGVARQVALELDCAVVAMRYPVRDEFAIALSDNLYEGLFRLDLTADAALPRAVAAAALSPSGSALSIATPTLFGFGAVGLSLSPPIAPPQMDPSTVRMERFPDEPLRFVGRARVMATASAALAPRSPHSGVLLHGMAGAGKTACALELAYRHQDAFATLAYWEAPQREDQFGGALTSLALALEAQLGDYGFAMVDKIDTIDGLRRLLPRLSRLLEQAGLLLVLDNLETLLTPTGVWRDQRWAELAAALTGHGGESRTIMTSRIAPTGLDSHVLVQPMHALSRDETVLLARELPHLRSLLHADAGPPRRPGTDVDADRATVREVLNLVQGHPKLLELADAAAADPTRLAAHIASAQAAAEAREPLLAEFFGDGESSLDADGFLSALFGWTATSIQMLPDQARLLMRMLCLLEDDDRQTHVVEGNWAELWRRLNRADDVPAVADALAHLTAAALVHAQAFHDRGDSPQGVRYRIHPAVVEAVRADIPTGLRAAVDIEIAAWWTTVADWARNMEGGEHSQIVVHAALAAAPYLQRRHDWETAADLLGDVIARDRTPAVIQAALPHLQHIALSTGEPRHVSMFAAALATTNPDAAERLTRDALAQAVAARDFGLASVIGGRLVDLLRAAGRWQDALDVLESKVKYTRRAGLGPWTCLADRGRRLQILYQIGQSKQVLVELSALLIEMRDLSDQAAPNENVTPSRTREAILGTGLPAAFAVGRWQYALDLNAEVIASLGRRKASPHEFAYARVSDHVPLIRLGRLNEADELLRSCQQVFEDYEDIQNLGKVLSSRAFLENERGHLAEAVALEKSALRLKYIGFEPEAIYGSHNNLAQHLAHSGADPAGRLAHRLASVMICQLTGLESRPGASLRALASDLYTNESFTLPESVAELAEAVQQVEGVRFAALIATFAPHPDTAETALAAIVAAVNDLRNFYVPVIVLAAAIRGDQQAAEDVDQFIGKLAISDGRGALADVWRRVLAGERDPDALQAGLNPADTVIAQATLAGVPTTTNPPDDALR